MADLTSPSKAHSPTKPTMTSITTTTTTTTTTGGFLLKSLLCALFLFALPLFPSEAPAFLSHTPFTNLWELLHLLFIGIAVSYGLFSRRNADDPIQASGFPDPNSSRMENLLSIFDVGCHEKGQLQLQLQRWDSGQAQGETFAFNEKPKTNSFNSGNSVEIPSGYAENTEIQSWNSQYFQCQPMIVVAHPNYSPKDDVDNKPLGLPVRSLRSSTAGPARTRPRTRSGSCSSSGSGDSSIGSDGCKNGNFGEVGPLNLEEKFDETVSLPSPIPWGSRSGRMDTRRASRPTALKLPLHSRHLSVEESQFRNPKSRFLRSNTSFASHTSSVSSSSPNEQSPVRSATPDFLEVKMEEVREKNRDLRPSVTASPTDGVGSLFDSNSYECANRVPLEKGVKVNVWDWKDFAKDEILDSSHAHEYSKHAQRKFSNELKYLSDDDKQDILKNKAQAQGSHPRNRMNGSFNDSDGPINCKEGSPVAGWSSRREDNSNSSCTEGSIQGSSKLNPNPQKDSIKASFRGKSVRTFRTDGKTMGREKIEQTRKGNTTGPVQHKHDHLGPSYPMKAKELHALGDEFVFLNEDAVGRSSDAARTNSSNYQMHDEKKFQDMESINSKEEVVELQAKSKPYAGDDIDGVSDVGTEADEVDRKAGEFIAKFREQIRLQKTASIDSSSVLDFMEDHYQ
ncbi:uncharacterized protein LOC116206425 [Punica granatum]|uniref:Uncharacterized protein LOC116206425 n=1 Tax=Punica granatum TaxID=22663 RepID=A0A6P8DD53_PUNGR|nr:uncharacterized protein LOC116206425 [Punica granatum]